MKTIAIVQARTGSSRLPGKVLMDLGGQPNIHWVITRIKACSEVDKVVLATTTDSSDDALAEWAANSNANCFRGSEEDVLKRYYDAAIFAEAKDGDIIVRITGDCPLIDPNICGKVIRLLKDTGADYVANTNPPTFPDGLDCEAFYFQALQESHVKATLNYHREHVTQYILNNPQLFHMETYANSEDLSGLRWTLDELADYVLLSNIFKNLDGNTICMDDVLEYLDRHKEIADVNSNISRNEGLEKSIQAEQEQ